MKKSRVAYFDCFSGISGDMCLGALVDAGVDINDIERELKRLRVKGFSLTSKKVLRAGISATKVDVILKGARGRGQGAEGKKWKDIEKIIKASSLSDEIKQKGLHIFKRLFEAEARVHGEAFEDVHLHELGGIDCLVDIFGTLIGLNILGVNRVFTSPINLGSGTVKTEHGILPVPAPATAELLKSYPVYTSSIPFELTTPTGAAIISGLEAGYSHLPETRIETIGYGAGRKDFEAMPNTLRIIIGDAFSLENHGFVTVIETNIDDMNPQIFEDVVEKLFRSGALDVFMENIIMKKGRPAIKLTVIVKEGDLDRLSDILFRETTTIGLRFYRTERRMLEREVRKIKTEYGYVRVKVSSLEDNILNIAPEYEDLKVLSKKTGMPIKKLTNAILKEIC